KPGVDEQHFLVPRTRLCGTRRGSFHVSHPDRRFRRAGRNGIERGAGVGGESADGRLVAFRWTAAAQNKGGDNWKGAHKTTRGRRAAHTARLNRPGIVQLPAARGKKNLSACSRNRQPLQVESGPAAFPRFSI